jgi:hypothetical protein
MNRDQLLSLVRSLAKVIGAALISHGLTKAAAVVNAEDTIGLIVMIIGFVASHLTHSDSGAGSDTPPATGTATGISPSVGRPGGTRAILAAVGLIGIMGVMGPIGCVSFNANVFNSEKLAVDGATAATHIFNQAYPTLTNGASVDKIASINSARDTLYSTDKKLSGTVSMLDSARAQYALSANSTNKAQVQLLLSAVLSQSTNIVTLVKQFTH